VGEHRTYHTTTTMPVEKEHMSEAQIAVLIDFENVGLNSIQGLFDQLSDLGRVIVKRAYADWSAAGKQRDQVLELGIEAVHHFHAAKVAKNSSDISLAIDAVDLLYRSPVDTFVIVSADSDFVTLVSKLRSAGKTVIGAGRRDVVSTTLVRACDRYIYLESPSKVRAAATKAAAVPTDLEGLLQRAIEVSADPDGRVVGSKLHQTMTRIEPSFDFKELGYRTFTQFLESASTVQITKEKNSNDILVKQKGAGLSRIPVVGSLLGRGRKPAAVEAEPEPVQPLATPVRPAPRPSPSQRRPIARPPIRPQPAAPQPIRPQPAAPIQPVTSQPITPPAAYEPVTPPPPTMTLPATPSFIPAMTPPQPTILPPQAAEPTPTPASEAAPSTNGIAWDTDINERWSNRVGQTTGILNGTRAAAEAARVLGVPKLSSSRYKTLQSLLSSSTLLSDKWSREGNTLHLKAMLGSESSSDS
jgi:uncharacterized protein (TIGR00288 family)